MFVNAETSARRGYTLIEVLVVTSIISLLIAILIPAIQYARESSRRLACVNNLKQVGMALNSYEASHGVYPQGTNGSFYSAHAMILPYLDQPMLFNSLNYSVPDPISSFSNESANFTPGKIHLAVFCCPSDPDAGTNSTTNYSWNGGLGLQNYDFIGSFGSAATVNLHSIKPSDLTDGLSNTAAMSEWQIGRINSSSETSVVFKVNINKPDPSKYGEFIQQCEKSSRRTTEFGSWMKDALWVKGIYGSTLLNFNSPPNSLSCFYGLSSDFGNWPASSYHASGVNVLFHDNHVSFYKNTTSLDLWKSIGTRSANDGF